MDSEEGRELMAEADGRVHEDNTEERVKVGQDARFNLLVVFLALSMLTAGTVQTVSLKFQDKTIVDESTRSHFSHPAVQSAEMFVGELLCLLPHFALRLCAKNANQSFAKQTGASPDSADPEAALEQYFKHRSLRAKIYGLVGFAIPAACDACATTLLNVGLLLTFASVYQMLRGSLVLFTGLLAATVLRKRLHAHHWIGMGLILVGAIIIGVVSVIQEGSSPSSSSSSSSPSPSPPAATTPGALHIGSSLKSSGVSLFSSESAKRILGDVLIVLAQLLMATQFVVEEKLMTRFKTPPLLAVGLEGFWGLCMFGITLPLLALLKQSNGQPVESLSLAISQIADNRGLFISTLTAILAISFFNAFGLAITRYLAAGTRATIDALRTISVYCVGLALGWEHFHWLEVVGFVVLFSGSCTYNKIIPLGTESATTATSTYGVASDRQLEGDARTPLVRRNQQQSGVPMLARPLGHYALARSVRVGMNAFSPSVSENDPGPQLGTANGGENSLSGSESRRGSFSREIE